ncbi:MAG: ATP-binding cassette domain-containing protein [Gemmatimonadetes bacterium]|nr:ATP-binding cassette domain-containing protein [Gemmatimonadota bacterium]
MPPAGGPVRTDLPPAGGRAVDDTTAPPDALLEVRDLRKHFPVRRGLFARTVGAVRAVDGVSFWVERGRTLGLVGESGSGKTTTGRTLLRLIEPPAGRARFAGQDIFAMDRRQLRQLRRRAQIVFQDPYGSLDPRMTVGDMLREVLQVHRLAAGRAREARVRQLLDIVGLSPRHAERYPHEFSGGQRQRIGIARALSVQPEFIVCDEPVSALDVSVQAQVLNLLRDLQRELKLSYLFIAHDLGVVEHISHDIAVMYLGRIVELGRAAQVIGTPCHPYTRALLSSVPTPDPVQARARIVLSGDMPSPAQPPSGSPFHPRCPPPRKDADCVRLVPPLAERAPGHFAACIKEPAWR